MESERPRAPFRRRAAALNARVLVISGTGERGRVVRIGYSPLDRSQLRIRESVDMGDPTALTHWNLLDVVVFDLRDSGDRRPEVLAMADGFRDRDTVIVDEDLSLTIRPRRGGALLGRRSKESLATLGLFALLDAVLEPAALEPPPFDALADWGDAGEENRDDREAFLRDLASGLAHQINNPATYITANLHEMSDAIDELRGLVKNGDREPLLDDFSEMLADCRHGMSQVLDSIRGLGLYALPGVESARDTSAADLVRAATQFIAIPVRHSARLVCRADDVHGTVENPQTVLRVLVHALARAAEAVQGGDPSKDRIIVSARDEADGVVFAVEFTGLSLNDEELTALDHRAKLALEGRAPAGSEVARLGESLRKIGAYGGIVRGEGNGVRIEIFVPRRDSAPVGEAAGSAAPGSLRILLVDDDALVRETVSRALESHHRVITAPGGAEALELLAGSDDVDLILCDLMMPDMDGLAFYECLLAQMPEFSNRLMFLTGGVTSRRARRAIEAARIPTIEKPIRPESLDRALNRWKSAREEAR